MNIIILATKYKYYEGLKATFKYLWFKKSM